MIASAAAACRASGASRRASIIRRSVGVKASLLASGLPSPVSSHCQFTPNFRANWIAR